MNLPKNIMRRLWRTIIEFDMLFPDDRVLVGLSGGKDSSFLLYALAALRENAPFDFDLAALHVDQGFVPDFDTTSMDDFCQSLGVPFAVMRTRIYEAAFGQEKQSPCARCAFLRRGAVNTYAKKNGYNKVALAHHLDDALETFLMSQLYSGRIETFLPVTFLDRSGVTVIRPLVYFREKEIKKAGALFDFTPVDTPCPMAGKSMRARVKTLLSELAGENKFIITNLMAAMRENSDLRLWPPEPERQHLQEKVKKFWSPCRQETGSQRGNKGR